MNEQEKIVLRLMARDRGHALCCRAASALAPDPGNVVGIAPIKVVTEEVIQAIAFGRLDHQPMVLARLNPMSRDASDLGDFARWLVDHVTSEIEAGRCPRIWLPHAGALECLDILGHRYATNREASDILREMGRICRILGQESRYEGQQTVAIALKVLKEHVVTGQMSLEDNHLGAMLAWVDPLPDRSPIEVAEERARKAASGILVNTPDQPDDDAVENARRLYKRGQGAERQRGATRIRSVLEAAALREWRMLAMAREAFWNLGLETPPHPDLVEASRQRVTRAIQEGFWTPRRAHTLSIRLGEYEDAASVNSAAMVAVDPTVQEAEVRRGRIIAGVLRQVQQPRRNCRPCRIILETSQAIVRLRRDEKVRSLDGRIQRHRQSHRS